MLNDGQGAGLDASAANAASVAATAAAVAFNQLYAGTAGTSGVGLNQSFAGTQAQGEADIQSHLNTSLQHISQSGSMGSMRGLVGFCLFFVCI